MQMNLRSGVQKLIKKSNQNYTRVSILILQTVFHLHGRCQSSRPCVILDEPWRLTVLLGMFEHLFVEGRKKFIPNQHLVAVWTGSHYFLSCDQQHCRREALQRRDTVRPRLPVSNPQRSALTMWCTARIREDT